jgi:hypothetical protein
MKHNKLKETEIYILEYNAIQIFENTVDFKPQKTELNITTVLRTSVPIKIKLNLADIFCADHSGREV